eukprot:365942-Chlamydomonas_euryale.AAC.62
MAKLGEGDARWIVQDMGDAGKNVNNWHWREYDCMDWCERELRQTFLGLDLARGSQAGLSMKIVDVVVKGEAIVNNRKNKLIPAYELEVALVWEGNDATRGRVMLPYIGEENHNEQPQISWSSETDDAASQKLREAFNNGGKEVGDCEGCACMCKCGQLQPSESKGTDPRRVCLCRANAAAAHATEVSSRIQTFMSMLHAGGPMAPGSKDAEAAHAKANASAGDSNATKPKLSSAKPDEVKKTAVKANTSSSGKTLSIKEKYYARPSDIYECFVVEGKVRAYTQSNASVEPRAGGKFSWFNGSVLGEFIELEADRKLVMKWKFNTWADDCFSTVTITLEAPEHGVTMLNMQQTDIPHEDKFGQAVMEQTETGWRQQIFNRIRQCQHALHHTVLMHHIGKGAHKMAVLSVFTGTCKKVKCTAPGRSTHIACRTSKCCGERTRS